MTFIGRVAMVSVPLDILWGSPASSVVFTIAVGLAALLLAAIAEGDLPC